MSFCSCLDTEQTGRTGTQRRKGEDRNSSLFHLERGTMERLEERILIRSLECEMMLPRIKILF